jgi:DNA-binding CsgD family transcriptional regulator
MSQVPTSSSRAYDIREIALLAWVVIVVVVVTVDLFFDARSGAPTYHLAGEGLVVGSTLLIGGTAIARLRRQRALALDALARSEAEVDAERARGDVLAAEARRWREEAAAAVDGLSRAIDAQFDRWSLSDAEREVALLLLKGLSTKEIGDLRQTSDATVRQQARAIYAKAGLAGRAELSAWFLEDLLAPRPR